MEVITRYASYLPHGLLIPDIVALILTLQPFNILKGFSIDNNPVSSNLMNLQKRRHPFNSSTHDLVFVVLLHEHI
jgi:hypothetical protein